MHRLLTAALAVSLAGPCLADAAADEAAIRGRFAAWVEAFNARDAAGACDLFAPDLAYAVPDIPHGSYDDDVRQPRAGARRSRPAAAL